MWSFLSSCFIAEFSFAISKIFQNAGFEIAGYVLPVDLRVELPLLTDVTEARDLYQHGGDVDPEKDYRRDVTEGFDVLRQQATKKRRDELLRQIRAANDQQTRDRLLGELKELKEPVPHGT